MYTDDKNAQVVLALLKKYGIKKIVVSPGTTNVPISRSVQVDPWFEVYSVVDERSAAYFAGGLAHESGEPVVISCTGATASRNYLPGLTEAYYRHLPVIALTSQHPTSDFGNLVPQVTDRTVSQNDIKKLAVQLPVVKDDMDLERCIISVNKALIAATTRGGGPVHINLPVSGNYAFSTPELPDARKIEYLDGETLTTRVHDLSNELSTKKVCIFVGAHREFDKRLEGALEKFATKYGAAVLTDQTSGYRGNNAVLIAQIADLKQSTNKPDLIIDLGSVTGEYSATWLYDIETWRLSEEGEIHDRFHNQTKLFDCLETIFFAAFEGEQPKNTVDYAAQLAQEIGDIVIPDLPLSNTLISYELSRRIPKNSNLHMGILNSLRNMNFFPLDKTIHSSSNVGGFGIDGPLSTLVGQSMANRKRLTFGLVGDLASFYDMNALGIRHIANNIRILMVNNNGGVEFRLNTTLENQWSDDTNEFISAHGHNGSMKGWAESVGFHYMSALTKEELSKGMADFCSADMEKYDKPVLFEVFTKVSDEQSAWNLIRSANAPVRVDAAPPTSSPAVLVPIKIRAIRKLKRGLSKVAPEPAKKVYRGIRKRG